MKVPIIWEPQKLFWHLIICCALNSGLFPAISRADSVQYLAHPQQALAARSLLIKSAQKSIDLVYFIFEPCQASTQLLLEELAAKAKSGVKVRLILDAFLYKSDLKNNLAAEFASKNMKIKFYNDSATLNPASNMRSHIKLLLIDDQKYITGGRNMADNYFSMFDGINFIDRDVLVSGSSAKEATSSFQELWASGQTSSRNFKAEKFVPWTQFCGKDESKRVATARSFVANNAATILENTPKHSCEDVQFISDSPEFSYVVSPQVNSKISASGDQYMTSERMQKKRATKEFLSFLDQTQSKLEIENWSYAPIGYIDEKLSELRDRNVPIFVITNSASDEPGLLGKEEVFITTYYSQRDSVGSENVIQMALGGKLINSYELSLRGATYRLHGKVAVKDNRDVMVSSFNIDPRSYNTNLESMVIVNNCPELAQDLQTQFKWLKKVYVEDARSGIAPPPENPSILVKLGGYIGLSFF